MANEKELEEMETDSSTSEEIQTNSSIKSKLLNFQKMHFKTDYIQIFINSFGDVTADEMRRAARIFSDQADYFKHQNVSEFCRKAREINQNFIPTLSREKPLFGLDDISRYRQDEATALQYFCVEAARLGDDTRLINFICTMIEQTKEAAFWMGYRFDIDGLSRNVNIYYADYNALKNNFKTLLTLQQQSKIRASYISNSDKEDIFKFHKIAKKVANPEQDIHLDVRDWENQHPSPQEFIEISLAQLESNRSFEHLDLSYAGLQNEHIITLMGGLNLYPRLKKLRLANNHFEGSSVIALASALSQQSALTLLDCISKSTTR